MTRRRQWHPTPVLLPGNSHGRRSLVGCSPCGRWELDTTQWLPFHFSLSCIGEGNGNPLQCSCLENPRDGGAWWAAIYEVAQSRTRLKQLRSCYSKSKQEKTTGSFAFLLPEVGEQACSLCGVRVEVCPGFGPEGKLKWFAPFRWYCVQGACTVLCLAPGYSKVAVLDFFLISLYLLSRICTNCTCMQLFLIPYSFLVFCCSRRDVSRCKHCSTAEKHFRFQSVSASE